MGRPFAENLSEKSDAGIRPNLKALRGMKKDYCESRKRDM